MPEVQRFVVIPRKQEHLRWAELKWFASKEEARSWIDERTESGQMHHGAYILEGVEVRWIEIKTEHKSFQFSELVEGDSNVTES